MLRFPWHVWRVAGGARAPIYDEESVRQIQKSLASATKAHGGFVNAVEALARFISRLQKDAAAIRYRIPRGADMPPYPPAPETHYFTRMGFNWPIQASLKEEKVQ